MHSSHVDNINNLRVLHLSERSAEKIGIDKQFAVPTLIDPTVPIFLHLIYWSNT